MVDLGISNDEDFKFSDKNEVMEQDFSSKFVQRLLEDFKKDCEKTFIGINEKIGELNYKFNMAISILEMGVGVSSICKM